LLAGFTGPSFPFILHGSAPGYARARTIIRTQGTGLAKEELMTVEGKINEILPDGRFGVTLDNEHRIIAYTAGKMRRHRIRSVVVDRVHVDMTPDNLTKGRIDCRERTRKPKAKRCPAA
jgi:translation initiation factor IF-1